ncbi:unnamed protein product [Prunus armeniaca]|uniref:Proteasome component Ecm29 N-terminal domain-containing protein n=1 Tax=Prunus armeniaca TaxID=36596 RepID=A0A6J5UXF5_PRUAR|nr:unnamed protein product [Prunus armeniaca]
MSNSGSVGIDHRIVESKIAGRPLTYLRDKIDMAVRLFDALKVETQHFRLSIQEATNSLATAYKVVLIWHGSWLFVVFLKELGYSDCLYCIVLKYSLNVFGDFAQKERPLWLKRLGELLESLEGPYSQGYRSFQNIWKVVVGRGLKVRLAMKLDRGKFIGKCFSKSIGGN